MFDKIKKTSKHTLIFALGKISSKMVGFILLPIYTKEIAVSDYGILGLLEMIELLGVNILAFGLPQALLRWYSLNDSPDIKKKIVFSSFIFNLLLCGLVISIAAPFREVLSSLIFNNPQYGQFLFYVFLSTSFQVLAGIPQATLRAEEKSILFSASIIAHFSLSLVLNIYFVAFKNFGVKGVLLANVISSGINLLIFLPYLMKRVQLKIDYSILKDMTIFGYPFVFTAIVSTILNLGDRYLLTIISNFTDVGLYSLGYKFSNIIKVFIIDSFILSLPIVGWQLVKNDDKPKKYFAKTFTYLIFGLLWMGLMISIFAKNIILLFTMNQDYWDAYRVIPCLVMGVIILGLTHFLFFILQIPHKTKNISLIITVAAVFNMSINILLIPRFGMMGAAYATVLANGVAFILAYSQVQKHYHVHYEMKRIIKLFAVAILIFFSSQLFNECNLIIGFVFKAILIFSYPLMLGLMKFYEPSEIDRLKKMFLFSK